MTQFEPQPVGRPVWGCLAEIHFADHVALTGIHQIPTLWNIHTVRSDAEDRRQGEVGPMAISWIHRCMMDARLGSQFRVARPAINEISEPFKVEE